MPTQTDPPGAPDSSTVPGAPAIRRAAVLGIDLAVTDYDGAMDWMDAVVRERGRGAPRDGGPGGPGDASRDRGRAGRAGRRPARVGPAGARPPGRDTRV